MAHLAPSRKFDTRCKRLSISEVYEYIDTFFVRIRVRMSLVYLLCGIIILTVFALLTIHSGDSTRYK